jgi:hypothetical protein
MRAGYCRDSVGKQDPLLQSFDPFSEENAPPPNPTAVRNLEEQHQDVT